VKEPIEGAQVDGAVGFLKGVGKGLTGAALRPVAGTIDLLTKTGEGLVNTPGWALDRTVGAVDATADAVRGVRARRSPRQLETATQ